MCILQSESQLNDASNKRKFSLIKEADRKWISSERHFLSRRGTKVYFNIYDFVEYYIYIILPNQQFVDLMRKNVDIIE